MPDYIVKHGGVWAGGKLVPTGGVVTLSAEDRQRIDPDGTLLASGDDVKAEAAKKKSEAADLAKKAAELEAKSKGGAK